MITILTQPWAQRLGWTLLHSLWEGALIAALYALVRIALGKDLMSRARYAIACAALLAMAAAPAITYLSIREPATPAVESGAVARFDPGAANSLGAVVTATDAWQRALPWIVMAWFAGVLTCFIRLVGGHASAAALRHSSHRPAPPEWQAILDRLVARMRIARNVSLLVSTKVESLVVIGWLRPVVLAPAAALCGVAPESLEALLAHELAHIQRHDYLINVLQGVVESLLFYHPAVWWFSKQIRTEREHCCDEIAAAASGDVLIYARALAELESTRPAHRNPVLAANDGSLVERIRHLIDPAAV